MSSIKYICKFFNNSPLYTINGDDKKYNAEEIAKIAPHYKGKPENFDPSKIGPGKRKAQTPAKTSQVPPQRVKAPPIKKLPTPELMHRNTNPTPQKNHSLLEESIFGCEVTVVPIAPKEEFTPIFAAVPTLAEKVYREYTKDVQMIDRKIVHEEKSYYFTGLLWLRLLDIKQKYGITALTTQEKTNLKDTKEDTYNVPQTYFLYLSSIGSVVDKMGKRTFLNIPNLPTTVIGNKSGYHADAVTEENHCLFEEVPSLGVAGDVLMTIATIIDEPVPAFGFTLPQGAKASSNMLGTFSPIGKRWPEIAQRLTSYGITEDQFAEYCRNTRFNRQYFRAISDMLASWDTFRLEKVNFAIMKLDESTVQIVKSIPTDDHCQQTLLKRDVKNTSPEEETTAIMGAAFAFRFQLQKEPILDGDTGSSAMPTGVV